MPKPLTLSKHVLSEIIRTEVREPRDGSRQAKSEADDVGEDLARKYSRCNEHDARKMFLTDFC